MINWIKQNALGIFMAATVSIIFTGIFVSYMVFIGRPKTQARNDYNKGMLALEAGNEEAAIDYFEDALDHWNEKYIREELELYAK